MTLTTAEKAILLSKLGLSVFPWKLTNDGRKVPLLPNGHTGSSTVPEQIATWFTLDFPTANIGVNAGASGLVILDLDKKNGLDGEQAIDGWVDTPDTWGYETPTGGRHLIYADPGTATLAPSKNYEGFEGVDVRAGSSWAAYYGDTVPESRDAFTTAPDWLLKPARDMVGSQFEGGLDEWLEGLIEPDGEPSNKVLDAITRIPDTDFGHVEMVERTFELIRLGAEGQPGVLHAITLLRDAWLRPPYDTYNNRYDFDKAIESGIRKAGALEDRIANLPEYSPLVQGAAPEVVATLLGRTPANQKNAWFKAVNTAIRFGHTDDEVLSLVWHGGTTKELSRDWGIEFCAERVVDARAKIEEREEQVAAEVSQAQASEVGQRPIKSTGVMLLTDAERQYLAATGNFIHRYVAHANERFDLANPPYHASNAWTVASLVYGSCGFVPMSGKNLGLNLFQMSPGESSTGKSDSIILRQEILRKFFANDLGFDISTEASPEMLHEEMLLRAGAPTFFNTDEAAGFFAKLAQHGSWSAGLEDKITDWYGGWVGPVTKRAAKATLKDANKGGPCYFVSHFFATPDRLFGTLNQDQFLSGFLARFLWNFGNPATDDASRHDETQPDATEVREADGWIDDLVLEFNANREHVGTRRAIKAGPEELRRLSANRAQMERILRDSSDWKITESAYRRLCDSLRKCAALLALTRGSTKIMMIDVLGAIEQAEAWVAGLVEASRRVSSSTFEREAREIALAVKSLSAGNGWVTDARLYRRFARFEPREFRDRMEWATRTGLVVFDPANKEHQDRWAWKGGVDDE